MNTEYFVHEIRTKQSSDPYRSGVRRGLWRRGRALARLLRRYHYRMRARAVLRHELARVDDRLLQDMGGRRRDLEREACKPFWRH